MLFRWSSSQNPLFVKGLCFFLDLFLSCMFLFWIIFCLKKKKKELDAEDFTRPKSNRDVMLGSNPSRPALEPCLDCLSHYTAVVFVPLCFINVWHAVSGSERSIPWKHAGCTISVIFYTLVPLGGRKPPETSENESNELSGSKTELMRMCPLFDTFWTVCLLLWLQL